MSSIFLFFRRYLIQTSLYFIFLFQSISTVEVSINDSMGVISVVNEDEIFDHITPYFILKSDLDEDCEEIWWQISTDESLNFAIPNSESIQVVTAYQENPYVDPGIWNNLSPYFLPEDHPIRDELDNIFSYKKRVTQSKKTLKKAKFKIIREGKYRHPYVVSHPSIQGYLLKLYTDKQEYNTKRRNTLPMTNF